MKNKTKQKHNEEHIKHTHARGFPKIKQDQKANLDQGFGVLNCDYRSSQSSCCHVEPAHQSLERGRDAGKI